MIMMPLLCLTGAVWAFDDKLQVDFEQGIPTDFAVFDLDGNTPSADTHKYGFQEGGGWVDYYFPDNGNRAACSTSWYRPAGTANDWLITSPVSITDPDAVLEWRSRSLDKTYRDGLTVYVSDKGQTPECFEGLEPLFCVNAENQEWTHHSISLSDYIGQDIYVAFVNNSTDKSILFLDDLFVGAKETLLLDIEGPFVIKPEEPFHLNINVSTGLDAPITSYTLTYICNGEETIMDYPDAQLQPGSFTSLAMPEALGPATEGEQMEVKVILQHADARIEADATIVAAQKRCVVEEGTGTWCGWCVRGIVAMEQMAERFTDQFLGVAVHNSDIMTVNAYDSGLSGYCGSVSYPFSIIDRNVSTIGDPAQMEQQIVEALSQPVQAAITAEVDYLASDSSILCVHNEVILSHQTGDDIYRIGYILTEDDVHVPDDFLYAQHNSYANGSNGEMGGYENYGSYIPASEMFYQHVGRYASSVTGISGSLPQDLPSGVLTPFDSQIHLPDNILQPGKCRLISYIYNLTKGQIENAVSTALPKIETGIEAIHTDLSSKCSSAFNIHGQRTEQRSGLLFIEGKKVYIFE